MPPEKHRSPEAHPRQERLARIRLATSSGLFLQPQAHAGASAVQELDSRLLQNRDDLGERVGPCADRAVKVLHSPNGAQRHFALPGKLALRPAQEGPRRAYLPAADGDQRKTVSRASTQDQESALFSQVVDLFH